MTGTRKPPPPPTVDVTKLAAPLSLVAAAFGIAWQIASWKAEVEAHRQAMNKEIAVIEAKLAISWTVPERDRWIAMLKRMNPTIVVPDPM